jgi:hypothetical protein
MKLKQTIGLVFLSVLLICADAGAADKAKTTKGFYKAPGLFSTRPGESKSMQTIARFGPVGMGIELHQPAFVMKIKNIEEGSPAEASGKFKKGQIIETINGQKLADIDPRMQLAQILGKAEATDGVLKFAIKGLSEPVTVKVPILGSYSPTWPLKCAKSDKIVRQVADYLSKPKAYRGIADIGIIFLLSTGDEKDLAVVRKWARSAANRPHTYAWYIGFGGVPLCEYYLRTGDKEVLPGIQKWVDNAVKGQYLDGWAGRGGVCSVTYGNGHLNAGGTAVVTFLLLAKECGVDVPEHALMGALVHFYRYAGRGGNPYGDGRTEVGFVDNGKNGNLAFAMAAAASLTPEGEESVYAGARDACAMTSFYTTTFMLHGHTGGGIGEIWRSSAMGLLYDKKPKQYREFMDNRKWHYELSRRFDGSFGILGGGGYDNVKWGMAYPMAYTIPRKTLRITGAPPSKYSKKYQLPKIPWGTKADNIFVSLEAVPDKNGKIQDLSGETLAKDSSMQFIGRFHGSQQPSDDVIRQYMHHQSHNIRFVAANKALGVNSGYIGWRKPGGKVRKELVMEFLQHKDPRVRRAMFMAIYEILRREKRTEVLTREIFDLAVAAVKSPSEAWAVKDPAMQILGHGQADWVVPHVDCLLGYLNHKEWWLQNAALTALTPVVADERCYKKVLPVIGELIRTNQRSALTMGLMGPIRAKIKAAGPDVHKLAIKTLKESYTGYAGVKTARGGQNITSVYDSHLTFVASSLADVPGGLDVLYEAGRQRFPQQILPYKEFFLAADPSQFGPKLKEAITPIIINELIPEYVGRSRLRLQKLAAAETQSAYPGGKSDSIDGLAALHKRASHDQYDWHMFADLNNAEWSYHTFDPIAAEQVAWDQLISRYREVTLPKGMENWFASDFDPTRAGWKRAKSPFGHYMGKLPKPPVSKCSASCVGPICYGATKVNTLWDKEVLLMRGTFKTPAAKKGHRYRVRINHSGHVGNGGGYGIYLNGKLLIEQPQCVGRGGGGKPKGAYITKEFLSDINGGELTIAVKSFLRFGDKYKVKPSKRVPQGRISLHIEEQKLPPIGDDLVFKSAAVIPMLSSAWQAKQDPDDREKSDSAVKFRWDGKFVANPKVLGSWNVIAEVAEIADFDPSKKNRRARGPFGSITFKGGGKTSEPTWAWSGDTLMDLTKFQALKMQARKIDGVECLFVEKGGFSTRNKPGWKCQWYIMKRS